MKSKITLIFLASICLALSACGDDDGGNTGTDANMGDATTGDAAINTPDGSVDDASTVDNRTKMCGMNGPSLRAVFDEPRCATSTQDCLNACETTECVTGCIDADETEAKMQGGTTIDCGFCLSYEPLICVYNNGCDTAIANANCCALEKCAGMSGDALQTCANAMCNPELTAQQTCIQANAAACNDSIDTCFPAVAGGDAGMGDAATADAGVDAAI